MKNGYFISFVLVCCLASTIFGQLDSISKNTPSPVALENFSLSINNDKLIFSSPGLKGQAKIKLNGSEELLSFQDGTAAHSIEANRKGKLILLETEKDQLKMIHVRTDKKGALRLRNIPLWLSLIPPLIAIFLALIFKEVILSLFIGIWSGAFIAGGLRIDSIYYFLLSIWEVVQKFVINALTDGGHQSIIVFSMLIGGMVAIISRNGGMAGVVLKLSKYARSTKSAQFITWLLGVAIFFDDYANTLIVGNTMRSVTDKFNISREKLAYIVDSTAAPVAAIAFITTWIGAELGYIDDGISLLDGFDEGNTPYYIFIQSLKYSFYPILTLLFILILIYTGKDYGGMYEAEVRARTTGQLQSERSVLENAEMEDLSPVKNAPLLWWNAVIPVLMVILMTIVGLVDTGMANTYGELVDGGIAVTSESWNTVWVAMNGLWSESPGFFMKLGKLIGNSDSYIALLWASLSGVLVALLLTLFKRIMNLQESISTMMTGFKTMLPALLILILAWSLAATTEELHTANYLSSTLQGNISPYLLPVLIFVLASFIAFSTGSSWSTMAILYPIAIPTTWAVCQSINISPELSFEILLNVISVVLAASVLGDHCSPISDTTILSSLASDCNHIDHVRTQLPYALTVGGISIVMGGLATLLGGGWLISFILLAISIGLLWIIVWRFGKKIPQE